MLRGGFMGGCIYLVSTGYNLPIMFSVPPLREDLFKKRDTQAVKIFRNWSQSGKLALLWLSRRCGCGVGGSGRLQKV